MENEAKSTVEAFNQNDRLYIRSQSPVSYRGNLYDVQDLLNLKAKVLNKCQNILREYTFQTTKHAGSEILKLKDDNGFIIEPLLELSPLKPTTDAKLQDVLRNLKRVSIPRVQS